MIGKPTKLNPKVQAAICAALEAGNTLEGSVAFGRIDYQTHRNWMIRGEIEKARLADKRCNPHKKEAIYVDYFEAIKRAIDYSEASIITQIKAHGKKQWTALAWLAERRWPKRWAKVERRELSGPDGGPIVLDWAGMADGLDDE